MSNRSMTYFTLLEITLKSRQNQDTCLGTNRQWIQRKNIYFIAKKQEVSLGFPCSKLH